MKTYPDECLDRALRATEGPWSGALRILLAGEHISNIPRADIELLSNARTDIPELARRLKMACEFIREAPTRGFHDFDITCKNLADELEAPLNNST